MQLVNRQTARLLGIRQRDWPTSGRVSVAKVAKDQSRGVVHFHAIFRLNGADPPDPAPSGATTDLLCDAIRHAAARTSIDPPECPAVDGIAPVVWGEQIDLRSISTDVTNGNLTDGQVAGYLAKYATKGAAASGTVDRLLAYRDCRHCSTRASTSKTVQTRLGHANPRTTLAFYAQATTRADREAADRLGERFLKLGERFGRALCQAFPAAGWTRDGSPTSQVSSGPAPL